MALRHDLSVDSSIAASQLMVYSQTLIDQIGVDGVCPPDGSS
jgi:hypothetical protein